VLEDYRHPDIVTSPGNPLELDFFYPQLNIAVEYQVTIMVTYKLRLCRGNNIIEM
jgi:hypothetical protein